MNNEQPDNRKPGSKSRLKKILSQPGIQDAIDLTQDYASERAVFEAIEQGARGEFGDELKALCESEEADSTDRFLEQESVDLAISENYEYFLMPLAVEAGPKIADLWELSESAGKLISLAIYDERDWEAEVEDVYARPVLLVSTKDVENNRNFTRCYREIEKQGFIVGASDHIPKGRIFLDVTEITSQRLRFIYKAVKHCRQVLNIKQKDIRAGSPKFLDGEKALEADLLKKQGKSHIEIAKKLGFKIYRNDYDQDAAPQLYKYKKLGKALGERLNTLEKYLKSLQLNIE
jgi:hypothetical protein